MPASSNVSLRQVQVLDASGLDIDNFFTPLITLPIEVGAVSVLLEDVKDADASTDGALLDASDKSGVDPVEAVELVPCLSLPFKSCGEGDTPWTLCILLILDI